MLNCGVVDLWSLWICRACGSVEPVDPQSLWSLWICGACGSAEPVDPRSPGSAEPLILGLDIMIANEHRSLGPIFISVMILK